MNRRHFLATTALASTASWAADSDNFIDAHVHVWPAANDEFPPADSATKASLKTVHFTPEDLLTTCRPHGVQRVVLIQMSFYKHDNRYMLHAMKTHPGTFSGVAIVDENAADLVKNMQDLTAQGVRGYRLYASADKAAGWSQSTGMKNMWTAAADHGTSMCLLADPGALPDIERMCTAYPRTSVVIDHFARIGMKGAVNEADLEVLCRLAKQPQVHVKTSAFYALGAKKAPYTDLGPMIRKLRDAYGAQRLMWASDCPFQVEDGHTYADSIALIRDRLDFLTADDKAWMLRKTAEKVFFGSL